MKQFKYRFVELHLGSRDSRCLVTALHAHPPHQDLFTGEIARRISQTSGCSVIVSRVSRTVADLNRPRNKTNKEAIDEYRLAVRRVLMHAGLISPEGRLSKPFLHIDIHGMKDTSSSKDIEIGTLNGKTCSPEIKSWFIQEPRREFP